ncbi:MAG TPA: ABC transporter permease [Acidimicrobiales bacterium]|nr:ABC transporter permease [Acidimicrobiales bacterium]
MIALVDSALPPGSKRRTFALAAAITLVTLLCTQLLFDGPRGRGTPGSVLFRGFVVGMINSLVAVGIVLVYRTSRIINFAQASLGVGGALLCYRLIQFTPLPFLAAFVIGVLAAGLLGMFVELVILRRFANSPRLVLMVATLGVAFFIAGPLAIRAVEALPFIPDTRELSLAEQQELQDPKLPFEGFEFTIGDQLIAPFGFAEIFTIEVAVMALLAMAAFFRYTRAGVAVRAVATNPERANLLGISVSTVNLLVWGITGMLSGATLILFGVLEGPDAVFAGAFVPEVIVIGMVAAVLARMQSIPAAAFWAVLLTTVRVAWASTFVDRPLLIDAVFFVVLLIGLLLQRDRLLRSEARGASAWQAVREQRPIPRELDVIPVVAVLRRSGVAVALAAAIAVPFFASVGFTNTLSVVCIQAIAVLSLVVLTGWAGQVSLAQWSLVGVGAVTTGVLTADVGLPFWLVLVIAPVVAALVALVIGLPALRVQGLYLAILTTAFAFAFAALILDQSVRDWLIPEAVERPTLFLLDFEDWRSMYYLTVVALVGTIVIVRNLRRSRLGRLLIGLRENEANLQSFGVSVVRAKLTAFAISGAITGFAGALYAVQQRAVSPEQFAGFENVQLFLMAVLGGLGSVVGPLLGAGYFAMTDRFVTNVVFHAMMQQFGFLLVLLLLPGGLISGVAMMRDAVLRIVAQRRQLVVPSLFADFDPDAIERKLIPLGEPAPNAGLAALPADERWSQGSELYPNPETSFRWRPGDTTPAGASR